MGHKHLVDAMTMNIQHASYNTKGMLLERYVPLWFVKTKSPKTESSGVATVSQRTSFPVQWVDRSNMLSFPTVVEQRWLSGIERRTWTFSSAGICRTELIGVLCTGLNIAHHLQKQSSSFVYVTSRVFSIPNTVSKTEYKIIVLEQLCDRETQQRTSSYAVTPLCR